jgi:fermentation-respiration switch protein FrsA (DUF1100 family)
MLKLALELLAVLVALAVLVRLLEPRLAFFPLAGETETPRDFGVDYEPLSISTEDGEQLRAWSMVRPDSRASVLYFHGNGGNLSIWAPILTGIALRGYSVLALDYRGYGMSTGRPTERGLYRDVEAAVARFWADVPQGTPVVYWGRSLGVAMAACAATIRPPDGLVLEAGFPDARSVLRSSPLLAVLGVFSTYRFPAVEYLRQLTAPVPTLVLHGDDDRIVPVGQGRALFERIGEPKELVIISGGDHNDPVPADPGVYWQAVDRFVASLQNVTTSSSSIRRQHDRAAAIIAARR